MSRELLITGIDTDTGKSIATGMIARFLAQRGVQLITQKMVQTGCADVSEDILIHRRLMGVNLFPEDRRHLTCPYLFRHPASPHLAAEMEGKRIDPGDIRRQTQALKKTFDMVLVEGAGGLQVPLNRETTILDYIETHQIPVVLVSSSRLGSINHTLLSIDALRQRGINLNGLVYNRYPESDPHIADDSVAVIASYLRRHQFKAGIVELGFVDMENPPRLDFSGFFPQYRSGVKDSEK